MSKQNEREYTFKRLDEACADALRVPFDPQRDRIIVLSDVHKGDRERGSDDFEHNETVYCCALDYYFKNNFKLVLAGDIEDGWECDYDKIISCYKDTAFAMEKRFADRGRCYRIYGNHDGDWSDEAEVDKYLKPVFGEISVHPALFLGDKIIVVHGHQGDLHSDRGAKLSRSIVRFFWKLLQDIFRFMNTRAAENNRIRSKRDRYLYEWAKMKRLLLIAGHTHRGMFESYSKTYQLVRKKEELEDQASQTKNPAEKLLLQAAVQKIKSFIRQSKEELTKDKEISRLGDSPVPCYFNDGCCVHTNGMTGIEIDRGTIRLVKWEISDSTCSENEDGAVRPAHLISPERKIYQSGDLEEILGKI